jgi:hypothetical protein
MSSNRRAGLTSTITGRFFTHRPPVVNRSGGHIDALACLNGPRFIAVPDAKSTRADLEGLVLFEMDMWCSNARSRWAPHLGPY